METTTEPVDLEQIRVDLVAWRGQRRRGERIPAEIWERVAAAVQQHGLKKVSRTLGLDYDRLKRKVGGGGATSERPLFVELKRARAETGLSCVVELEKGNGTRLRIHARDGVAVDWGKIKEAFLGA
jgi:hypothetical protein